MKNIKSYFKRNEDKLGRFQQIFLPIFEILIWSNFAAIHFLFFKKILYLPKDSEILLRDGRFLEFPFKLNQVIFGSIIIILFQILRIGANYLTKRILFSNGTNNKFIAKICLSYIHVIVAFSTAVLMCNIFFSNEAKLFFDNNLDLVYYENSNLGYLNPIVNSFNYYMNFIISSFRRIDFTLVFILLFGVNLSILFLAFLTKKGYLELRNDLKKESNLGQISIFGAIQHELGNKLPTLKIDLEALNLFLKQESSSSNSLMDKPIRKKEFEGDYVESVSNLIDRIFAKVDYCINATSNLNGFINADPNKFKPQKVKLIDFFEQEALKYIGNQPNIILEFVGNRNTEGVLDKKQFSTLLENVISNALMHGFTEMDKTYTLKFIVEEHSLSGFNGKFSKSIKILNNGNPFPISIKKDDYSTAMKYGGTTGNSGYGGFLISKIIENHSGEFDIFDGNSNIENGGIGIVIYIP
jgi:hypothetical protein